jgi:hypothetical protein
MRLSKWLLLAWMPLAAQPPAPIGIVRGSLVACDAACDSGELRIRAADHQIFPLRIRQPDLL